MATGSSSASSSCACVAVVTWAAKKGPLRVPRRPRSRPSLPAARVGERQDRATLEPAAAEAEAVVAALMAAGFLLSTDGPLHNVLKFKPPMCFSMADARALVAALDRALGLVESPAKL